MTPISFLPAPARARPLTFQPTVPILEPET